MAFSLANVFKRRARMYLDYAAATPVDPSVETLVRELSASFANPGALHEEGVCARRILDAARAEAARALSAAADEIVFTSGGTEGNNLATLGHLRALNAAGMPYSSMRVLTSAIEHSSVREPLREAARLGVSVAEIPVTEEGVVDARVFPSLLTEDTVLVSVMLVNNEIGTIQPVRALARAMRAYGAAHPKFQAILHSDASQAPLFLPVDVRSLAADLVTLDGLKVYGPRGAGLLFRRRGVPLAPVLFGGGQESSLRPGTENPAAAAGLARALTLANDGRETLAARAKTLQESFLADLAELVPQAVLNGSRTERVPGNVNVSVPGQDGEFLSVCLDREGIAVTAKSACLGHGTEGSSVVAALGLGEERARGALRFSFGRETTRRDVRRAAEALSGILARLDRR